MDPRWMGYRAICSLRGLVGAVSMKLGSCQFVRALDEPAEGRLRRPSFNPCGSKLQATGLCHIRKGPSRPIKLIALIGTSSLSISRCLSLHPTLSQLLFRPVSRRPSMTIPCRLDRTFFYSQPKNPLNRIVGFVTECIIYSSSSA